MQYTEEELLLRQQSSEESLLAEMRRHDEQIDHQRQELNTCRMTYENRINKLTIEMDIIRRKGLDKESELSLQIIQIQQSSDERIEKIRAFEQERTDLTIQDLQQR